MTFTQAFTDVVQHVLIEQAVFTTEDDRRAALVLLLSLVNQPGEPVVPCSWCRRQEALVISQDDHQVLCGRCAGMRKRSRDYNNYWPMPGLDEAMQSAEVNGWIVKEVGDG